MFDEIFYTECIGCRAELIDSSVFCAECMDNFKISKFFCESCGHPLKISAKVCSHCISKKHYYNKIYVDYLYEPPVSTLLKQIKFQYRINGINIFKNLILASQEIFSVYDLITYVPSHLSRNFRRFAHPAKILAKYISEISGVQLKKTIKRQKRTDYQWKLDKNRRKTNVKEAFKTIFDVKDLKILLVDDIITTGSTVEECSKTLMESGASKIDVYCFCGKRL